jgi:hypothetical protein
VKTRWHGIITHWREVAAQHGCHFENYLARCSCALSASPMGVFARSMSGHHVRNVQESWAEDAEPDKDHLFNVYLSLISACLAASNPRT